MKGLKVLIIAAIAATGLMAFLGVGMASATALCTTTTTPDCVGDGFEEDKYGQGTILDFSATGGSMKGTDSNGQVISTCTVGTIKLFTGNPGSTTETVSGNIQQLTWSGCNQTTDTVANGSFEIHWIEGTHNGTVTGKNSQWTTQIFGVSCTYGTGTGTHLGTLTGGAAPELSISTTIVKTAGGFLCPSTAGWDAEYVLTEPHALFVTTG